MKREPPLCKLTFRAPKSVRAWFDEQARVAMKQIGVRSLSRARGIVLMEAAAAYKARIARESETKPA